MTKNAYIHIPFCKNKCNYCSFVSFKDLKQKNEYLIALEKEITKTYNGETLNTIYLGGGTPSVLKIHEIEKIINFLRINQDTEVTIELNPEGIDIKYLNGLKNAGINRLSIGAQTFDDKILEIIGRKHSSTEIIKTFNAAKEVGFENISLDLIYGLPNQTIEGFKADLEKIVSLNPEHVSLYGLKIEENCKFADNKYLNFPDADTQADMYLLAINLLTSNKFIHYEISNFSKENFQSKHNLNYWNNNSYYGFGLSASGYENKIRYTNEISLEKYLHNPYSKVFKQEMSQKEMLEEEIFLGFRKTEGINTDNINKKFNIDFDKLYSDIISKYLDSKHIIKTSKGYALSTDGFLLSNIILADFI